MTEDKKDEKYDEMFPDEDDGNGVSNLSAVLKEPEPELPVFKPRKVVKKSSIPKEDIQIVLDRIVQLKDSVNAGLPKHRIKAALDDLETIYRKKLLL